MQVGTYFAIYFVVWWLCLFVVLPFKVKNQSDTDGWTQGTERGAPVGFRLWPKLFITTGVSAVVTVLLLWGLSSPLLREYWS